jgi:gas vesicle protein
MEEDEKKIAGAFLAGSLIGAAVAILYAPKSGRETRRDISKKARRIKNSAVDLIDETIEDVHEFTSNLQGKTEDIIEHSKSLSDKAKKEVIAALERGQLSIEKQRKRLKDAIGF